jgi:hypothetical protein
MPYRRAGFSTESCTIIRPEHHGIRPRCNATSEFGPQVRKIIESDRSFSSNPDSHFHRKRTPVFMNADSLGAMAAAHAGVVSGV